MMKVLLVDDEQLAIERMSRLMDEFEEYSIIGVAHTGDEAVKKTQLLHPDIVILDVRMPIMDGIEAARHISELDTSPAIIFSSAFDEYALDAYGVQASDYVLKPVQRDRLLKALTKAVTPNQALLNHLKSIEDGQHRQFISARSGKQLELIPVESIKFFMADQKYVRVVHEAGEVLIEEPLKQLESEFNQRFIRIHRNALVALDAITRLEKKGSGYCVHIKDDSTPLDVSRRCLSDLKKAIQNHTQ